MRTVALITLLAATSAFADDVLLPCTDAVAEDPVAHAEAPPLLPSSDAVFEDHVALNVDVAWPHPKGLLKAGAIFGYVGAGLLANAALFELVVDGYAALFSVVDRLGGGRDPFNSLWPGPGPLALGALVSLALGIGLHIASTQLAAE